MITEKQRLGKQGEDHALAYLEAHGLRLLERNWRYRRAEIDLVMMEGEVLVFIEVKTRSTDVYGHPLEFVRPRQVELLSAAASAYMDKIEHEWEIRFDLVSLIIYREDQSFSLEHIKDAFFPGLHDW